MILPQSDKTFFVDSHGRPAPFSKEDECMGGGTVIDGRRGMRREWERRRERKLWLVDKINEKNLIKNNNKII